MNQYPASPEPPYQRLSIGMRVDPRLFGPRLRRIDHRKRGLPEPPPGSVWLRWYRDAVLIDGATNEVLDIRYAFFD